MEAQSIEKTAFCPGPGYSLWEFTVMPYGLTCTTMTVILGNFSVKQPFIVVEHLSTPRHPRM